MASKCVAEIVADRLPKLSVPLRWNICTSSPSHSTGRLSHPSQRSASTMEKQLKASTVDAKRDIEADGEK